MLVQFHARSDTDNSGANAEAIINRVSNTPENPGNLLEISKVSWKFSG